MNTTPENKKLRKLLGEDYASFMALINSRWLGPFTIDSLLDQSLNDEFPKPPDSHSVYLISEIPWEKRPSPKCSPLYVGSTTGKSPRFRTRMGDVIIDMFGFFQDETGHSSGGISLHRYCKANRLNPKSLYIGWLAKCGCMRCAEYYFWDFLEPQLNKKAPPRCPEHLGKNRFLSILA